VTTTAPFPGNDLGWHERDREAHLLAGLLRMSRLTLLYGEPGSGKTTLLRSGVMPLLRRRGIDRLVDRPKQARVVVPFPDRRAHSRATGSVAEVAFYFDAWQGPPLPALRARIAQILSATGAKFSAPGLSLIDTISLGTASLGARFLFIFDRFEEYLSAPPHGEGVAEFADEFVRAVSHPSLPANFLVSMRDEAEPTMTRFRSRISGYEDACLRLPSLRRSVLPPLERQPDFDVTVASPASPASAPVESNSANVPPDPDPDFEASAPAPREMFERLDWSRPRVSAAKTADAGSPSMNAPTEQSVAKESAAPAPKPNWPEALVAGRKDPEPPLVIPPDLTRASELSSEERRKLPLPLLIVIAVCIVAAVLAVLMWPSFEMPSAANSKGAAKPAGPPTQAPAAQSVQPAPAATAPAISSSPPAASPGPAPIAAPTPSPVATPSSLKVVADAGNSIDAAAARDIARIIAANSGVALDVVPTSSWAAGLAGLHNQPGIAIAHYDALQAARKGPIAGKSIDNLRVVMPLFPEEIYFVTRSNSPLDYIHEIEGKKINIGPAESSRALTATTVYERMFGTRMRVSQATYLDEKEALQHLLYDRTVDVMVLVGAPPATLVASATSDAARSIKILELKRDEPESRRALQAYLPASVSSLTGEEKVSTLAVMSFLVTSDTADPGDVERLGKFARSLCTNLPALQREGNRRWHDVEPGEQLSAGWPYSAPAAEAFRLCRQQGAAQKATPAKSTVLSR
jgi:TRAP-type uncharacterized transport system substrate-binding protein